MTRPRLGDAISYTMCMGSTGDAATFRWQRVSRGSTWLRRLLDEDDDEGGEGVPVAAVPLS